MSRKSLRIDLRQLPPSPFLVWNTEARLLLLRKAGFNLNETFHKIVSKDRKTEFYWQGKEEVNAPQE
jgi:hypothetical protein